MAVGAQHHAVESKGQPQPPGKFKIKRIAVGPDHVMVGQILERFGPAAPRHIGVTGKQAQRDGRDLAGQKRLLVGRARRLQRVLTQPFFVAAAYTGMEGRSVPVADTVAGCAAILAGECDDWDEASLYMIGTLDEARAREAQRKGAAA